MSLGGGGGGGEAGRDARRAMSGGGRGRGGRSPAGALGRLEARLGFVLGLLQLKGLRHRVSSSGGGRRSGQR